MQRFDLPEPGPHEALVEIDCCTVCGSDLHTLEGKRNEILPTILGHEILGHVIQVGQPAPADIFGDEVQVGSRVTWSTCISCFACDRCLGGLPQKCRHLDKYGHALADGPNALSGGLAEYLLLRKGSAISPVRDSIPASVLCPANCATATVAAAFRTLGEIQDQRVLIFGAGMLGLTACAFAAERGARHVTICDPVPSRLEWSRRFGADGVATWSDDPHVLGKRLNQNGSSLYDAILELSGASAAVEAACRHADIGSNIALVGSVMKSPSASLDPERIVRSWHSISGVHNYEPQDLATAVEFLEQSYERYPFADLVEASFTLDQVNEALQFASANRPVRVAIKPERNQ